MSEQEQRTPQEIQEDIERTRENVGDTAAALADKADVKSQAQAKIDSAKHSAQQTKDELLGRPNKPRLRASGPGRSRSPRRPRKTLCPSPSAPHS